MTDPLIVVEGNLRLPPTRPLADPRLKFGGEWSSARNRPVQSNTEVPLYAARLETAYVEAVSLHNPDSPYRAMSIWAMFADGEKRRSMLRLMQSQYAAEEATEKSTAAEPIPLTVRAPVTGPSRASHQWPRSMKTAIALACAGLIAWLIFGQEHRVDEKSPAAVKPDSESGLALASASAASSVAATTVASQPIAMQPPVTVKQVEATPVASQSAAIKPPVAVAVKPVEAAPTASTIANAAHGTVIEKTTTRTPDASRSHPEAAARSIEQPPRTAAPRKQTVKQTAKQAAKHTSHIAAERPAYAPKHHASAGYASVSNSFGTSVSTTAGRDTAARKSVPASATSTAYGASSRSVPAISRASCHAADVTAASRVGDSLDTRALYEMLQHSPTLG